MRLVVATQQYGARWSGLGTYATNLVDGLAGRGVDVTVVCPEGMAGKADVHIVPLRMAGWERHVNYWLPLAGRFGKTLKKLFRTRDYDIVHFTDAREALLTPRLPAGMVGTMNDYYAASAPSNPFYFRKHYSDWAVRYPYYQFMKMVEPAALRKLDRVVANSSYVRDVLLNNYSLAPARIAVINYGIEVEFSRDDEIRLEGAPSILFVGANFQRKGLPDLLRAAAKARKELPQLTVHVVGEDKKADVAVKLAEKLGISGAVKFHGMASNEKVRMMRASMFVMPSLVEGFGIVFIEAMSAGMPVIGGRVGGTVELIIDGKNGFTVVPGDASGLAEKIIRLSTDEGLRSAFIEEGARTAREYGVDSMIDKTLELYRSL